MNDRRQICRKCLKRAVANIYTLKPLYFKSRKYVYNKIGLKTSHDILLKIINAKTMATLLKKKFYPTNDFDPRESGFCHTKIVNHSMTSILYIESFHSKEDTLVTTIHEYGHALFYEFQDNRNYSEEDKEGFSRWLEYSYLNDHGNYEKADHLLNDESVYGRGLRKMIKKGSARNIIKNLFNI